MPLADQPLEFTPRFNPSDLHMQSSYAYLESVGPVRGMDTVTTIPSMNSWTAPVAPGVGYPPIAPVLPSGPQVLIWGILSITFLRLVVSIDNLLSSNMILH